MVSWRWGESLGKNAANIDLGETMREYHGGGHKGVGASEFKTKEEALKVFEEINAMLNR